MYWSWDSIQTHVQRVTGEPCMLQQTYTTAYPRLWIGNACYYIKIDLYKDSFIDHIDEILKQHQMLTGKLDVCL